MAAKMAAAKRANEVTFNCYVSPQLSIVGSNSLEHKIFGREATYYSS